MFVIQSQQQNFANEAILGSKKWYFVTKIVLTYCEKNCSSDREKLLKFEAEGREFVKLLGIRNVQEKLEKDFFPAFLFF